MIVRPFFTNSGKNIGVFDKITKSEKRNSIYLVKKIKVKKIKKAKTTVETISKGRLGTLKHGGEKVSMS